MARGGVYKSEVKRARDGLLAQGKHPSLDAMRIALGNTGSKSTIHRFLKELEAEEGEPVGQRVGLNDALSDLVQRLAEQLQQDANKIVAEADARFKTEQAQLAAALAAQREESGRFSAALRNAEVALSHEQIAHETSRQQLNELRNASAAQTARIEGLIEQLDKRDQHITSLEQKHVQAREALEHFRTAAKEQRESEIRRHDHALQAVQLELRHAGDALAAKNHELQQLTRDNGRLLAQHRADEREMTGIRKELRAATERTATLEAELPALRNIAGQQQALQVQHEHALERLARSEQALNAEIDIHRHVLADRDRLVGRLQGLEEMIQRLEQLPAHQQARQGRLPLDENLPP